MHHSFLKEDFDALNREIDHICDLIKQAGREMGQSCREGAETLHDNFAYEEGERQQWMWSNRLRELVHIRNDARVVNPNTKTDTISIGRIATVRDDETGEEKTFQIGSFMVFDNKNAISYAAPLARIVIGAKVGERREGLVAKRKRAFVVLKIE